MRALQRAVVAESTAIVDGKTVDRPPKCSHCGRTLGEYMARPYSLRCRRCGEQTRRH